MSISPCCSAETIQRQQGKHLGEFCGTCDRWIRWVPGDWRKFIWPVGSKHKGETLAKILFNDRKYLEWAAENMTSNKTLQKRAQEAIDSTKTCQQGPLQLVDEDVVDRITRHSESSSTLPTTDGSLPW